MALHVGIIGLGYWGPNYVRNFFRNTNTKVSWLCDLSDHALKEIRRTYPSIQITKNYKQILQDKKIDCIAIATPPNSHYMIAKDSLLSNKHVLIAKPLATNAAHAKELLAIAKRKKLLLKGDLTYLYSSGIKRIKNSIIKSIIGNPLYYDSTRCNLGLIQKDVNVIWDLAPHDFAILDYCFGLKPKKVFAVASKHYPNSEGYEMAHITVNYTNSFIAHIHVSWLSPVKIRTILIGGTKKMIFYNDIEPDEKVKIYDKAIYLPSETITPFKPIYRAGNVLIPKLSNEEALFLEIEEFIKQITQKKIDYDNASLNVRIVELLEACDKSLQLGRPIEINL